MSIRRARRRSPAPIATRWCRACAHADTARWCRSMLRRISPASCGGWRGPATSSCSSAPAASRNGPTRFPPSLPRSTRWRERPRRAMSRDRMASSFPDIVPELQARTPQLRGRLLANQSLAELTWFRVGGPAQVLFMPEDEADLAYLLAQLPAEIPVIVIGLGSNLIVRDGGVAGIVIRLGRGFSEVKIEPGWRVRAGAAVPDVKVARAAQEAGISGLSFLRGIPGAIGGALRMKGGAYGRETKDALIEARGVDRQARTRVFANAEMHYAYRHCGVAEDVIFTQALFQGAAGDPAVIAAEMDKITESREATQPIKSRT